MNSSSNININLEELRIVLKRLYTIRNKNLRELTTQENKDFNVITNLISQYYGTDGYDMLYKEIVSNSDIQEKAKPGTVAGYFVGCLSSDSSGIENGCTIECLTGAPTYSDSHDISKCDKNVLLAVQEEDKYNFITLMKNDSTKDAIVYVNQPFFNFSRDEQKELLEMGIQNVIISHYDNYKSNYVTQDTKVLRELPIRQEGILKQSNQKPNISFISEVSKIAYSGNNTNKVHSGNGLIAFVILILVVLGIGGYVLWRNKDKLKTK